MGRPRKKASELTTEQAVKRLFPRAGITAAKKEAAAADTQAEKREERAKKKGEKSTKKDSKGD
jgi:hypothetical protein